VQPLKGRPSGYLMLQNAAIGRWCEEDYDGRILLIAEFEGKAMEKPGKPHFMT